MEQRTCRVCGTRLTGQQRKYCKRACMAKAVNSSPRQQANRKAAMRRYYAALPPCVCVVCGETFTAQVKNAKYCDKTCEGLAKSERYAGVKRAKPKPCARCGTTEGRSNQAPRLCPTCVRWTKAERRAARSMDQPTLKPWTSGPCCICGTPFVATRYATVCSRPCAVKRAKRAHRREHGSDTHRSRARRLGLPYEPINSRKVFERDGYRCGICGGQTDPTVKAPHHNAPTLDHIIPANKGGAHLYRNVQCAHFDCNWDKGDDLPTLTELIGAR